MVDSILTNSGLQMLKLNAAASDIYSRFPMCNLTACKTSIKQAIKDLLVELLDVSKTREDEALQPSGVQKIGHGVQEIKNVTDNILPKNSLDVGTMGSVVDVCDKFVGSELSNRADLIKDSFYSYLSNLADNDVAKHRNKAKKCKDKVANSHRNKSAAGPDVKEEESVHAVATTIVDEAGSSEIPRESKMVLSDETAVFLSI